MVLKHEKKLWYFSWYAKVAFIHTIQDMCIFKKEVENNKWKLVYKIGLLIYL